MLALLNLTFKHSTVPKYTSRTYQYTCMLSTVIFENCLYQLSAASDVPLHISALYSQQFLRSAEGPDRTNGALLELFVPESRSTVTNI